MPSLKMKTKSMKSCLKDKTGLHVCQKSSVISKSSLSHRKIAQNAEEAVTVVRDSPNASIGQKESNDDIRRDEATESTDTDVTDFPHQKDHAVTETAAANVLGSNPSSFETIFSPVSEYMDVQNDLCILDEASDNFYVPKLEAEDSDSSRSSSESQNCSVTDFNIADLIFSSIPSEGNKESDGHLEAAFLSDYKCEESSLFFDDTADYLVLPFLEDNVENRYDSRTWAESRDDSMDSSLYLAIHPLRSCDQDLEAITCTGTDQPESFDPHMFIRSPLDMPDLSSNWLPNIPPNEAQLRKPITLVLDLDETLVHSTLEHCDDADFTFPVFFNMKEHTVFVKQRPYLHTFLERVAQMFEIVVFTASQSIYAKQLLDILDPDGKIFSGRAYRESCIFSDGNYTKDLTVLGVDLSKVIIVDNSPQVFRLQVNNGIPIKSWFDDPSDTALISLLPFLEMLVDADDVRPIIAKRFGNKE